VDLTEEIKRFMRCVGVCGLFVVWCTKLHYTNRYCLWVKHH